MAKKDKEKDLDFDNNEGQGNEGNEEKETVAKGKYGVKKTEEGYAVVTAEGDVVRVYVKEEGCEDPKDSAISYAKKLAAKK